MQFKSRLNLMTQYIKCKSEMSFLEFVEFVAEEFQSNSSFSQELEFNLVERDGLHYGDGQYFSLINKKITLNLVRNEGHANLFDSKWNYWIALKSDSEVIINKIKDFLVQSNFHKHIIYEITSE